MTSQNIPPYRGVTIHWNESRKVWWAYYGTTYIERSTYVAVTQEIDILMRTR